MKYNTARFNRQTKTRVMLEQFKRSEDHELKASEDYFAKNNISKYGVVRTAESFTHIDYVNETNTTLVILDNMGIKRDIPPFATPRNVKATSIVNTGRLGIRYSFSYHESEAEDIANYFRAIAPESDIYLELSKIDKVDLDHLVISNALRTASVTIYIGAEVLNSEEPVFIQELGLLVGTFGNHMRMKNPANLTEITAKSNTYYNNNNYLDDDPAFVRVKAYSKQENRFDKLYIEILGYTMEVPVEYDPTGDRDGIEIYSKRRIGIDDPSVAPAPLMLSFEEAFNLLNLGTSIDLVQRKRERDMKDQELTLEEKKLQVMLSKLETEYRTLLDKYDHERERWEEDKRRREEEREDLRNKIRREEERSDEELRNLREKHQRDLETSNEKLRQDYEKAKHAAELAEEKARAEQERLREKHSWDLTKLALGMLSAALAIGATIVQFQSGKASK